MIDQLCGETLWSLVFTPCTENRRNLHRPFDPPEPGRPQHSTKLSRSHQFHIFAEATKTHPPPSEECECRGGRSPLFSNRKLHMAIPLPIVQHIGGTSTLVYSVSSPFRPREGSSFPATSRLAGREELWRAGAS
jgi:hypothetical protein